ncbi:MAG: DNA alkylation repair protein [Bacteroidia bacterium]
MPLITRKSDVQALVQKLEITWLEKGDSAFVGELHEQVLKKKVRFPLLEYFTREILSSIPEKKQLALTDKIIPLDEIGSYVVTGIILQHRLEKYFSGSLRKAQEYIIRGDKWYVCDIIGERVMGHALLTSPGKTLPVLRKMASHKNTWIVRCIGVAAHYAIKKGLEKKHVEEIFLLLLSLSDSTDFHIKKGIGWAAKTTAKFYPDIIGRHQKKLDHDPEIKQWFKTKIKIGLGRSSKYASRYPG